MEIPIPGEIVFIFRRGLAGFFIIVVSVFSEWWRLMTCGMTTWMSCSSMAVLGLRCIVWCHSVHLEWPSMAKYIKAETKWPSSRKRHFKWIFLHGSYCILIQISLKVVPKDLFESVSIDSDYWLVSKRRQTIILTNDGLLYYSPIQIWLSRCFFFYIFRMWPRRAKKAKRNQTK